MPNVGELSPQINVGGNIGGAFFAFVIGGWIAARNAGLRSAEPAMLHGGLARVVDGRSAGRSGKRLVRFTTPRW